MVQLLTCPDCGPGITERPVDPHLIKAHRRRSDGEKAIRRCHGGQAAGGPRSFVDHRTSLVLVARPSRGVRGGAQHLGVRRRLRMGVESSGFDLRRGADNETLCRFRLFLVAQDDAQLASSRSGGQRGAGQVRVQACPISGKSSLVVPPDLHQDLGRHCVTSGQSRVVDLGTIPDPGVSRGEEVRERLDEFAVPAGVE
ncbi:hypothetical protein [Streptomyces poonensis]|uniref:hypothetical protein n=1 Tax=Streptomyces poonensis TaxID=68255 RepID=UPI0027E54303|nr:hypothetical protein [Streptomyces poonensis]